MRIADSATTPLPPKLGLRASEKPDTRKKVCCLPPRFPLASRTLLGEEGTMNFMFELRYHYLHLLQHRENKMHDPNEVCPNGLTYAEIDQREADSVRRLNELLVNLRGLSVRWWGYSVSHHTFDMVVGDPLGRADNVVLCFPGLVMLSGPIAWQNQQLCIRWTCDRESKRVWWYQLVDDTVGFSLEADGLRWRKNFDIHTNMSIWFSANAPVQSHTEFLCSKCRFASYGYHPYCAECGHKMLSEARMCGLGLTRPVESPLNVMNAGLEFLRSKVPHGESNSDS